MKKRVDILENIWYPNKAVSEERTSCDGGDWYNEKTFEKLEKST